MSVRRPFEIGRRSRLSAPGDARESSSTAAAWLAALGLFAAIASITGTARAETCEATPDAVIETFPASGSREVPLNGVVRVRYCPADPPIVDRSEVRLLRDLGEAGDSCSCEAGAECLEVGAQLRCLVEVAGNLEVEDDQVTFTTDTELAAQTTYVIEAPEPEGIVRISFHTSDVFDTEAPIFGGLQSVRVLGCGSGFPDNAACPTDSNEEGFVAVLTALAADDDAGAVNIVYSALQVRGDELIERGRARGDGASDVTLSVFIPAGELTSDEWERLCFTMIASDPYEHTTAPSGTVCEFTPEFSPFGSACAVVDPRAARPRSALGLLVALALLAFTAFSRRSRRL